MTVDQTKPVIVILCAILVSLAAFPAAGAAAEQAEPSLTFNLDVDGDAEVILVLTYDLETDDERDAFETLRDDAETREDIRDRFESRMATVAADASEATDRSMAVDDATVTFETTEDGMIGVVTLTLTWEGLAAVEDERLVITEPFASGYEPDQSVTVVAPSGYEIESSTPEPTTKSETETTWEVDSELDDFELVFTMVPAEGSNGEAAAETLPGFGLIVGLLGLLLSIPLLRSQLE